MLYNIHQVNIKRFYSPFLAAKFKYHYIIIIIPTKHLDAIKRCLFPHHSWNRRTDCTIHVQALRAINEIDRLEPMDMGIELGPRNTRMSNRQGSKCAKNVHGPTRLWIMAWDWWWYSCTFYILIYVFKLCPWQIVFWARSEPSTRSIKTRKLSRSIDQWV